MITCKNCKQEVDPKKIVGSACPNCGFCVMCGELSYHPCCHIVKDKDGKEVETWKSGGAYYTLKGLLPETLPIATGTGNFMKSAVDDLNKDEFQNPPYEGQK